MNYIIDGFNLAFVVKNITGTIKEGATEKAIRQLIHFVRSAINIQNSKVIIVFDGADDNQPKKIKDGAITILFSKKPQTADDIIRNFIRKTANKDQWTVVTSDNEILFTARDHGMQIIQSATFKNMEKQKERDTSNSEMEKSKHNPDNIDLDYWRDIFNAGQNE